MAISPLFQKAAVLYSSKHSHRRVAREDPPRLFPSPKGKGFLPEHTDLIVKIVAGLNLYLPVYSDATPKRSTWDTMTANYPLRPYLAASKINSGISFHTTGSSSFVFDTKMNLHFDRPSSSTSSLIRSSNAMYLPAKDNS